MLSVSESNEKSYSIPCTQYRLNRDELRIIQIVLIATGFAALVVAALSTSNPSSPNWDYRVSISICCMMVTATVASFFLKKIELNVKKPVIKISIQKPTASATDSLSTLAPPILKATMDEMSIVDLIRLRKVSRFFYMKVAEYLKTKIPKQEKLESPRLGRVFSYNNRAELTPPLIESLVQQDQNEEGLKSILNLIKINGVIRQINFKTIQSGKSRTPLEYWAEEGNLNFVHLLVEEGACDQVLTAHFGTSALFYTAQAGQVEVVKYLTAHGAASTWYQEEKYLLDYLKPLVALNAKTEKNREIKQRRLKCLEIILTDLYFSRPIPKRVLNELAIHSLRLDLSEYFFLLKSFGADLHRLNVGTKLFHFLEACTKGDLLLVQMFVEEYDVDINFQDMEHYTTPLHLAAASRRQNIVDYLMLKGANPNLLNDKGENYEAYAKRILAEKAFDAMYRAMKHFHSFREFASFEECLSYLDEKIIDINRVNKTGKTLLHLMFSSVSHENRRHEIPYIIAKGARLDIRDNAGKTPIDYGIERIREMEGLPLCDAKDLPEVIAFMFQFGV